MRKWCLSWFALFVPSPMDPSQCSTMSLHVFQGVHSLKEICISKRLHLFIAFFFLLLEPFAFLFSVVNAKEMKGPHDLASPRITS